MKMGILWHERAQERGLRALRSAKDTEVKQKGTLINEKDKLHEQAKIIIKRHSYDIYMTYIWRI